MYQKFFFLSALLLLHESSLSGSSSQHRFIEPIAHIDSMTDDERLASFITATEETLAALKKIAEAITAFREQEKICIKQKSGDQLFELSKRAYVAYELITEREFQPYFRKEFIDELQLLSQAYKNKSLPSPQIS